ncbi:DUF2147 domain-containing protein [uncultured Sulfitobacter sp.]|uniref:DUF2147 domain-containing protein n=1 Tax=uncultured Sulfitobacter sp. TaxID=191468 RepID=UPI0026061CF5|nr:DUF2147 domain-containing protein [uncultured Sulfitobacter sp.]
MKTFLASVVFGLALASTAWAADPIEGLWKTQPDDGVFYHVKMQPCGGGFCGVFQKKFEGGKEVASDVIGKNAVFDMKATGGGSYEGKAWKPSNNKTYKGTGEVSGNKLRIGGCVLGGLICLKQTWTRVN